MTISIWRYSHLVLALSSGLFLILASVTGIVLAFEPMQTATNGYNPVPLNEVRLSETIAALQQEYDEVLSFKVDQDDYILANVVTKEGDNKALYVHPKTAKVLGIPEPQHPIFSFTTNLHRSLFLKSVGRFFVGLVSFLLCLIAVTGLLLIIKRQGGLLKFFNKVQPDYFELRYHVVLGRWFLLPIILIAATGVYLSAEKFSLLPSTRVTHKIMEPEDHVDENIQASDLTIFKEITMDQVRLVSFPFSPFPEDYFELGLQSRELYVHQYTGTILSEQPYPFTYLASRLSLTLHTGQGSVLWSLILLLASSSILFFIYSGFVMWRKRVKNSVGKSKFSKDESSHILLYGSETGNTNGFVLALQKGLIKAGKRVFVAPLNSYTSYKKATDIFILTSTYGEGEAPTNANKFLDKLETVVQPNQLNYSVIGFGSLSYPLYCQFAIDVAQNLRKQDNFKETLPLVKINNQAKETFLDWIEKYNQRTGERLRVEAYLPKSNFLKPKKFEVIFKTKVNVDQTFLLQLKPRKKIKFQSGDLLAYRPKQDQAPRLYSIAKYNGTLLLSIKIHEHGICSRYFSTLETGNKLKANIQKNTHFHFPKKATSVTCIANGTGLAPFLGLIAENKKRIPLNLFWGGRTKASFQIYEPFLSTHLQSKQLQQVHLAYSQEGTKLYIQQVLELHSKEIAEKLHNGGAIMICGSLAMHKQVLEVLDQATLTYINQPLRIFEEKGQILSDCY